MIYAAVKYILVNDSDVAAAVGTYDSKVKVYPIGIPQGATPPFVEFSLSSTEGNPAKDSASIYGLDYARCMVRVLDTEVDDVIDIAKKIRIAMDTQKGGGTFNSEELDSIDFDSMTDGVYNYGADQQLFYIDLNFDIWIHP